MGSTPVVNECDGEYTHDPRKNILLWTLPIIDINNKSGSLEFSATALPGDFFPLHINFVSKKSYADLSVSLSSTKLMYKPNLSPYPDLVQCFLFGKTLNSLFSGMVTVP